MEFPERISAKVTSVIAEQLTEFSEDKLAEINYGIAVFITNSYKVLILFILAIILNVFKYYLLAFMSFGLLRSFASGVHAKREWTCLPTSILLFFGIIYIGMTIKLGILAISLIYTLCLAAILKYAPSDTEERPITSRKLRKKLKCMSCITLLFLYISSLYYIGTPTSTVIALSALAEVILILPITYRLTGSMYCTGMKIKNKMEV